MKKKRRLGELIRIRRVARGLSQRDLARSVGVTASHVALIESGRRRPSYFSPIWVGAWSAARATGTILDRLSRVGAA